MISMELKHDEAVLIEKLRRAAKYSDIHIEKRPTKVTPDGEIFRISVEESFIVGDVVVRKPMSMV